MGMWRRGMKQARPRLAECLNVLREGDTLIVWRLDRLARSLLHLMEIAKDLEERNIGLPGPRRPVCAHGYQHQ